MTLRKRAIPCLLIDGQRLVKTRQFKRPRYIGDPINAVRIFNDKEVDELVFLDISKDRRVAGPNMKLIKEIASEAFMPIGYGGGISNINQIKELYSIGVEKVIINTEAAIKATIISEAAALGGSSGVVASMDVYRGWFHGYNVRTKGSTLQVSRDPVEYAVNLETLGAGEILLTSINNDGMMEGYDLDIIKRISQAVSIPVVACGGAGSLRDLRRAIDYGASAVAAGSIFIYYGKHRAVLISYPSEEDFKDLFG